MVSTRLISVGLLIQCLTGCGHEEPAPPSESSGVATPSVASDENILAESDRQFLWDVEHAGFVIEQTVFPILKRALRNETGTVRELRSACSDGFSGRVPVELLTSALSDGVIRHAAFVGQAGDSVPVDAGGFLDWLRQIRSKFAPDTDGCRVELGLVRLSPVARDRFNGAWKSVWKLRLAGHFDTRPIELTARIAVEIDQPVDSIADSSGWLHAAVVEQVSVVESDRLLMEDVTAESGIDVSALHDNWKSKTGFVPNTGGIYLSDYDQDGRLDILIDDLTAGAQLYRGQGDGTFDDVTESAGLNVFTGPPLWALSTWGDFDADGDDDLIVQDCLLRNNGNGTFSDVTDESNLRLTPAAGYAVADYDLDGRLDLYVCHSGAWHAGGGASTQRVPWIDGGLGVDNVLWRYLGDWQFEDVTDDLHAGGSGSSCFSAVWLHADGDGRPDLFDINEFGRNSLLRAQASGPWNESDIDQVFGGFSMGGASGDFDNDGHSDVYVANMYSKAGNRILANVDQSRYPRELHARIVEATVGNKLYRSVGDGTFEALSAELAAADVGWAYGAAFTDLDGDGWPDIYATAGFKSEPRGEPDG